MKPKTITCFDCQHFYITWDENFPRGCRAHNFKTKQLPSVEVLAADGRPCLLFTPKKKPVKR